jgi:hypothetical protein
VVVHSVLAGVVESVELGVELGAFFSWQESSVACYTIYFKAKYK